MDKVGVVILAGGGGSRLGGVVKADLELESNTFLDNILNDLVTLGIDPQDIVVVGPAALAQTPGGQLRSEISYTMEDPPGSGPAAGLLAGVRWLLERQAPSGRQAQPGGKDASGEWAPSGRQAQPGEATYPGGKAPSSPWIFALACDAPYSARALPQLYAALDTTSDGICATDRTGHRQYLLGIYRGQALAQAGGKATNRSVRALLEPLRLQELALDETLIQDVDTWQDFDQVKKSKR